MIRRIIAVMAMLLVGACLGLSVQAYPVEIFYQIGTSPINLYWDGEMIQNPSIGLNLSGGLVFRNGFSQLSLDVSISGYPITNQEQSFLGRSWEEYLGIGATLFLDNGVSFNGNWTDNQIGIGVNTYIDWLDFSAGTSWNTERPCENRQYIGVRVNVSMPDGALRMAFSTDWSFEDYSVVPTEGSVEVSFWGSFSIHEGSMPPR